MANQPPQPSHRERLGHDAERHPAVGGVCAGREPVGIVELEEPIDLVHQQERARLLGDATRPSNVARSGSMPVGLCGAFTTTSFVCGVSCRRPLQVHLPTGIFAELVEGHIGAGRPRDLVEALVAGWVTMA